MFRLRMLAILIGLLICDVAWADLRAVLIDETALSYDLSPSNYKNSSSNYVNSISNYVNSSSNYESSESNYENSPSNYKNTQNGRRRLIVKKDGGSYFAGYYVQAKNGTTNFFSQQGKRLFYNPKEGVGVFCEHDGEFCGVIANVEGNLSLALTPRGWKTLLLNQ